MATMDETDDSRLPLIEPNAQHQYSVTDDDLPLSCPMPGMHLWNSHPRVYLAIEQTGWAKCNYCGAEYTLVRGPHEVIEPGQ
ncbi:MAG TPA: zinc-finger domain-containing protein [Steroidobacteraceae bacterium]|nr:zinc-finger domain-containing protein [Steroidobacteraceae bacterium]